MNPSNPQFLLISIRTAKLIETVHFSRDVIGLTHLSHHGAQPTFELGGGGKLTIIEDPAAGKTSSSKRYPLLAFTVDDVDQAAAHLQAHGVELPWGIESHGSARWIEFYDPGGNLLEFAKLG